jgi:hypothetical protein
MGEKMTDYNVVRSRTTLLLVAGALVAWVVTIDRMRGMDDGPGTDLGGLGWFLGIWIPMTAAMMLPRRRRRYDSWRDAPGLPRRCCSWPAT